MDVKGLSIDSTSPYLYTISMLENMTKIYSSGNLLAVIHPAVNFS